VANQPRAQKAPKPVKTPPAAARIHAPTGTARKAQTKAAAQIQRATKKGGRRR
jgi:hypothetical protein